LAVSHGQGAAIFRRYDLRLAQFRGIEIEVAGQWFSSGPAAVFQWVRAKSLRACDLAGAPDDPGEDGIPFVLDRWGEVWQRIAPEVWAMRDISFAICAMRRDLYDFAKGNLGGAPRPIRLLEDLKVSVVTAGSYWKTVGPLRQSEYKTVKALEKAHPEKLSGVKFTRLAETTDPFGAVKDMARKYPELEAVLVRPGPKCKGLPWEPGYGLRWPPNTTPA
jgi:hypothetical protein